ncbi:hypothetical protein GW17_00060807 [Ensete ventricosum]|nr:hypothetical protein GW17_00060807 [Ensete ventricosum]
MRNIDQLESAYFSRCSRIGTPEFIAAMRSDYDVLKIRDRCSQLLNDTDEATDHLGTFFDGLCKFAQYSKFEVCGSLKNLDIVNSVNVICSLSFDRDEDYFAVAGVSKKIKIFEFGALLNESVDVHYPLIEMTSGSKLSYYRYADCLLLGGTAKIDRRWSIEGEKGKKKKRGRRKKYLVPTRTARRRRSCPRIVAALARRRFFSCTRRRNVSPCGEKDRGNVAGTRTVRYQAVLPKIDRRQSIEREKGKKKKKRKRRKKEKRRRRKNT